jgi:hypothetical protein
MRPVRKADNLPTSCADVKKSGGLNFLETCELVMGQILNKDYNKDVLTNV